MLSFYSKREDSNVERDAWCWLDVQLDLKLQGGNYSIHPHKCKETTGHCIWIMKEVSENSIKF